MRLHRGVVLASGLAIIVAACGSTAASPSAASPSAATQSTAPSAAASTEASASSSAAGGGKPLFVAINKAADQQYFIDLQTSFVDTITALGGDAAKFDAKAEAPLGVQLVNDAISKGAKGIAITVPDQSIGPAVATAAKDAGVALVATDDPIKDASGAAIPFVGFDGTDMGTKVGAEAGKLLTDGGWLKDSSKTVGVLSVEKQDLTVCMQRTDAARAEVAKAGVAADAFYAVAGDGAVAGAQSAAAPVITAHPNVTNWIVFGCNDESVLGGLNALAAADVKPEDIIAVGLGAYEACRPWAANQPTGFKAALYISGTDVGSAAAQALWDNVTNGTPLPPATVAKTTIVDPTSYATTFSPASLAACK
jgi:L-arabinose transport system substrate-binding protein